MIKNVIAVVQAFNERYAYKYISETCVAINTCDKKVAFTFLDHGNGFVLYAWLTDGELHIENESRQSVFDFASEMNLSEWDVLCIKYGEEKAGDIIRRTDALRLMKSAMEQLKDAWLNCTYAFGDYVVDCDHYIAEDYPFYEDFDSINVYEWATKAIQKIEKDLQ